MRRHFGAAVLGLQLLSHALIVQHAAAYATSSTVLVASMVSNRPGAGKKTYAIYKPKGVLSAASDDARPRRPTLTDLMHAAGTLAHTRLTNIYACACCARRREHAHYRLLRPPALAAAQSARSAQKRRAETRSCGTHLLSRAVKRAAFCSSCRRWRDC